ncbi:MAG TPA: winged helix-turn-helix domain-containing protein [Nitrososphaerales archaeon]|nr:winged helix-turn-helix domain-containing protein [Nitrososphaerales archaeon]
MKHRPRVVIYMEILAELRERPSGPTRISRVVNLSYDTCVEILRELEAKGLTVRAKQDGHDVYSTTPDGYRIVDDWNKLWQRLKT